MSWLGWAGSLFTLLSVGGLATAVDDRTRADCFCFGALGSVFWWLYGFTIASGPLMVLNAIFLLVNIHGAARHYRKR